MILLLAGVVMCSVILIEVQRFMAPVCGFDGQPDEHWQLEFNKLDHEWRMYAFCLESKTADVCRKEWGK